MSKSLLVLPTVVYLHQQTSKQMKSSEYRLEVTKINDRYRYTVVIKASNQPLTHEFKGAQTPNIRDDKRQFIAMTIDTMTCFSSKDAVEKYLRMAERKNVSIDNPDWKFETEIAYVEY